MKEKIINLIKHKDLLITLALKELKIKFKGAALGFLWSILNPLLTMLVLMIVFTTVFRLEIKHYPLFILCGLLPWTFFSNSLALATGSIIQNAPLIKKVPLPREVFPLAVIFANLINFLIAMALLLIFILIFGIKLNFSLIFIPIIILLQILFTAGICLFFSCITVFFRDINHIMNVLLMVWFYITPVFYPVEMVPSKYLKIYLLNPIAVFSHNYREILLNSSYPTFSYLIISVIVSVSVFIFGFLIFIRYEDLFGELV